MSHEESSAKPPAGPRPTSGQGIIARLARTPLWDLARGRLSVDARGQAHQAQLPSALATLVIRTMQGTKLRHREKQAIGEELIAQLQDALAEGATVEQLTEQFGEPLEVARLLQWAGHTRRSRPHRLMRRVVQVAGTVLLLLVLALRLPCRPLRDQPADDLARLPGGDQPAGPVRPGG